MRDGLTTVATYLTFSEAQLARLHLESAGLSVTLADEETIAASWIMAPAVGGIRLLVHPSDAEQAQRLLEDFAGTKTVYEAPEDAAWKESAEYEKDVARAFRATILSCLVCPGLGHAYSAVTCSRVPTDKLSSSSKRLKLIT